MSKIYIFPTDTVYGIGTSVFDKESINKIYEIKKRPKTKPLAVLCANVEQIEKIAYVNELAKKIISEFMPGPLTIILRAKQSVISSMGIHTVGVRIPNCKLALYLLDKEGPMATTSVNESGSPHMNDYESIVKEYHAIVDEIFKDDNITSSNVPSTIIDLSNDIPVIVRKGGLSEEEILKIVK